MSARAKFMFDVDFGAGGEGARRTVTLAAHEAALADAAAKAYRDGVADAQADAQRRAAAALERVAAGLEDLAHRFAAIEARLEAEAVEVAVAVARKLAPELIAREPFAEIGAHARLRGTPGRAGGTRHRVRRLPHRMGRRRHGARPRGDRGRHRRDGQPLRGRAPRRVRRI